MADYFATEVNSDTQERYRHQSRRHPVEVDAGTQSGAPGPKLPDTPPFRYKFKPNRYVVLGDKVIPYLSKVSLADGVNGAFVDEQNGKKKIQVGSFRANHGRGGGILIPLGAIPPEHAEKLGANTYLCTIEDRPHLHLSIYERVFPGSDVIEPDLENYLEFCEFLMKQGIVPRPGLHICRQRADEARARGRQNEAAAWSAEAQHIEDEARKERSAEEKDHRAEPPKPAKRRGAKAEED